MVEDDWEETRKRFAEDQARWDRKWRRGRIIGLWFLIPYGAAGVTFAWFIGNVARYSMRDCLVLLGCFLVIVFSQWTQPYLTTRLDRKDSISQPTGGTAASVEESATDPGE